MVSQGIVPCMSLLSLYLVHFSAFESVSWYRVHLQDRINEAPQHTGSQWS